jgi:hypothetical protein
MTKRAKVDFPEPDSPTMPKLLPGCRVKLTSDKACKAPAGWNKPVRGKAKRRPKCFTASSGADVFVSLMEASSAGS